MANRLKKIPYTQIHRTYRISRQIKFFGASQRSPKNSATKVSKAMCVPIALEHDFRLLVKADWRLQSESKSRVLERKSGLVYGPHTRRAANRRSTTTVRGSQCRVSECTTMVHSRCTQLARSMWPCASSVSVIESFYLRRILTSESTEMLNGPHCVTTTVSAGSSRTISSNDLDVWTYRARTFRPTAIYFRRS